jgi:hypothetical protein
VKGLKIPLNSLDLVLILLLVLTSSPLNAVSKQKQVFTRGFYLEFCKELVLDNKLLVFNRTVATLRPRLIKNKASRFVLRRLKEFCSVKKLKATSIKAPEEGTTYEPTLELIDLIVREINNGKESDELALEVKAHSFATLLALVEAKNYSVRADKEYFSILEAFIASATNDTFIKFKQESERQAIIDTRSSF